MSVLETEKGILRERGNIFIAPLEAHLSRTCTDFAAVGIRSFRIPYPVSSVQLMQLTAVLIRF
jgi:hypothetical protein